MSNTLRLQAAKLFDFTNKVAVVTGGGTGIGLMAAQALAVNGAKVYIVGRRLDVLQNAAKVHSTHAHPSSAGSLIPIQGDINSKVSIADVVKEVSSQESQLHVLINNAGTDGSTQNTEKGDESGEALAAELDKIDFDEWLEVYRTNVVGHYFTTIAFLPLLTAATREVHGYSASVINISSISGITTNAQHHFPYNVSKGASIQLSGLLAREFSRQGTRVRCNNIAPGIFPSEMTTSGSDDKNKSFISSEGYRTRKGIPAGRPGRDEDMAQAILSLAANQYINGQTLPVDGGYLLTLPSSV